jgi:hypothetical protein
VVQHLPSIHGALGSIPTTASNNKKKTLLKTHKSGDFLSHLSFMCSILHWLLLIILPSEIFLDQILQTQSLPRFNSANFWPTTNISSAFFVYVGFDFISRNHCFCFIIYGCLTNCPKVGGTKQSCEVDFSCHLDWMENRLWD